MEKPILTKDEITEKLGDLSFCRDFNPPIEFVVIGGSVVEDKQKWWSDIDIFISVPNYTQLNPEEELSIFNELHSLFYQNTKLTNIEISIMEKIPISVKFDTIKKGDLIYEKSPGLYNLFKYNVMKEYFDYKIWIDQFHRYARSS